MINNRKQSLADFFAFNKKNIMIKNVIIIQRDDEIEVYGCLTKICFAHKDFSYHFLKGKKFPFEYKGWEFKKLPYRK